MTLLSWRESAPAPGEYGRIRRFKTFSSTDDVRAADVDKAIGITYMSPHPDPAFSHMVATKVIPEPSAETARLWSSEYHYELPHMADHKIELCTCCAHDECGPNPLCGCGKPDCTCRVYRDEDILHFGGQHWHAGCLALHFQQQLAARDMDIEMIDQRCFALNASQHDQNRHPYTCGNDSKHRPLIATWYGWRCADCAYQQDYDFFPR